MHYRSTFASGISGGWQQALLAEAEKQSTQFLAVPLETGPRHHQFLGL